jgi:hypothetical protein
LILLSGRDRAIAERRESSLRNQRKRRWNSGTQGVATGICRFALNLVALYVPLLEIPKDGVRLWLLGAKVE